MADVEETILKFLVVDDQPFQRKLIADTLRSMPGVRIEYAENAEQCLQLLPYVLPDVLITDWDMDSGEGVALVRRVRAGDAGAALKKLPVIMITDRNKAGDIEAARNCGVDEFLLRPFSTAGLLTRVDACRQRRREFIESVRYIGPCRRRRGGERYDGRKRRLFDTNDKNADTPDVQIKKGLARMYAERITALLPDATPENADGMRNLFLACGQLRMLANDLGEALLLAAANSLFNYVQGVGAEGELNAEAVQAHLDALVQLAELPNSQVDLRQTVTRALDVMVSKKLRQAGASFMIDA
jgi:DNA-binding response OmpR family regulator